MSFISFARNFEDVMLWRALRHVDGGHYVDVGAAHPELDSVSRALYERGWRGVHVEPVAEYAALLRQARPDESVLELAVSDAAGTRTLNVLPGTGLSTFSDEVAFRHAASKGLDAYPRPVRTVTLTEVFEAAHFDEIHWLKVSAGGAEAAAIAGWDAGRFRPWLVIIEAIAPLSAADESPRWEPMLLARGYAQVYFDGLNRWFVRQESRELSAAFSAPPNVFDAFVTSREARLQQELEQANHRLEAARRRLAQVAPPAEGSRPQADAGTVPGPSAAAIGSLKLRAQQLGASGQMQAAEAIIREVLDAQPDDAEALAMLAIIDSDHGRHSMAVQRGLRAAQLTRWQSEVIRANLAAFIRRASHEWERARVLRRSLPLRLGRAAASAGPDCPEGPYDVMVLFPGPMAERSRFEEVFALQRLGDARVCRLGAVGTLRDKVREALECAGSDLLVFVNAEDVPLAKFSALVALLERSASCDWAFAQAVALDEHASSVKSAYGRYRQQLARLPHLPSVDFALFEQADVTGGVICIRRAALEQLGDRLPDLPFSVRAIAVQAALDCRVAMMPVDVVARPAAGFERDLAASLPLLTRAFRRLLGNAAFNPDAPMPRQWGVLAWSVPAEQGAAQEIGVQYWDDLVEEVVSLERQIAEPARRRNGVNLVGMPLGVFGLAECMRAFVNAADVAGLASCIGDLGVTVKAEQSDTALLSRLRDRYPYRTSIVFANPDILHEFWPAQLRDADRYRIGYWFWECDRLPKEWMYAFDLVDEIWVATEFVRAAVARSTRKPVVLMPHPIEIDVRRPLSKEELGLDEDVFWFLVTFDFNSFVERKNPQAAIAAFRAAFGDRRQRVGLIVKSINGAAYPKKLAGLREIIGDDDRIVLRDEAMPRDRVLALLNAADCYVSLHRSEGLGLGLAESMYLGKPVIGTAFSGNLDFMTEANSCLVGFRIVAVRPDEYLYAKTNDFHWAEADVEHAARQMRKLVADPHFRQSIAQRARADIRAGFDPARIARMMRARLDEVGVR